MDFEAFFAAYYPAVVQAMTLALGDAGRAEDAVQESFARAYRRWRRVSAMERPVGWVYVVAANVARDRVRADERARVGPVRSWAGEATTLRDPAGPLTAAIALRPALARLAPRQRQAVVLRYVADLSVEETGRAMGCTAGTVKATVHAALRRLRVDLEDEEVGYGR